jgi:hypothetical protein
MILTSCKGDRWRRRRKRRRRGSCHTGRRKEKDAYSYTECYDNILP